LVVLLAHRGFIGSGLAWVIVGPACNSVGMKRAITTADKAANALLRQQGALITRRQALAAGLTKDAVRHRLSPDGSWRVVLPGVYLGHKGDLTSGQREIAASLYAGRGCVITGSAALRRHGVRVPMSDTVDVLIPSVSRRQSLSFVQIHRTKRMPEGPWRADGLLWAPPARAVADEARCGHGLREVRAFVADAIQQGKCTVAQMVSELREGPSQGSWALRDALEEVADGVRSVAEGDLRKLIKNGRLPAPLYNPRLFVGDTFLAMPDAWWAEAGVAVEVDSREWHLSPADWERTQARHAAMSAHGILVLHYAPRRIRADGPAVIAEIRAAIEAGRRRPPLAIRAVPST
jgi:very-short-patch-repair endonuclease